MELARKTSRRQAFVNVKQVRTEKGKGKDVMSSAVKKVKAKLY